MLEYILCAKHLFIYIYVCMFYLGHTKMFIIKKKD